MITKSSNPSLLTSPTPLKVKKESIEFVKDFYKNELNQDPNLVSIDTKLFGIEGLLDSMGLVVLVVEIEEKIESDLGFTVTLADEKAMSRRISPFSSVRILVKYIYELINTNE